jgi:hypothetical protein
MAMVYQSVSWPPPFLSAKTGKSEEKKWPCLGLCLRVIRVAKHLVRSSSRSASEYVPVKATGGERTLRQCKTALWCCEIRCQGFRVMSFQTDLYIYIYYIYIYTYHIIHIIILYIYDIYIYIIWYSCENVKMLRSAWPEPLKDGGNKVTWAKAANCANCMAPVAWAPWAPWAAESDAKLPRKMRYVINEPLP